MLPLALFRDMWLKNNLKNAKINKHYIKITMTIEEDKFDDDTWYVLQKIKREAKYNNSDKHIPYFSIQDEDDLKKNHRQFEILKILENKGAIKISPPDRQAPYPECYVDIIQPEFDTMYDFHDVITDSRQKAQQIKNNAPQEIKIKNISFDDKNYILNINNGSEIVSFKSRKNKEDLEKETKQFKILCALWEYRREVSDGKLLIEGDITVLDNLIKLCGSKSKGATLKHIQRLNGLFAKKRLPIKIEGTNEKYRLIIHKTKT